MKLLASLLIRFLLPSAFATLGEIPSTLNAEALKFSEEDLNIQKKVLLEKRSKISDSIKKQTLLFMRLDKAKSSSGLFFDDISEVDRKRKFSRRFSENNLRSTLKVVERIDEQIQGVEAELEWTKWQMARALEQGESQASSTHADNFKCLNFPLKVENGLELKLNQDFGLKEDKETGLKWHSMGWWIESPGLYAQSCAEGLVVFSGPVNGRGHVVMLEHAPGLIGVYANLSRERVRIPTVGTKLSAKALLGLAQGRFYFEIRKQSAAIHPKKVMNAALLSHLKF